MYTDLLRFFFACLTWGPRDTKLWTRYLLKSIQFGSGCGVLLSSHGHIYIYITITSTQRAQCLHFVICFSAKYLGRKLQIEL